MYRHHAPLASSQRGNHAIIYAQLQQPQALADSLVQLQLATQMSVGISKASTGVTSSNAVSTEFAGRTLHNSVCQTLHDISYSDASTGQQDIHMKWED